MYKICSKIMLLITVVLIVAAAIPHILKVISKASNDNSLDKKKRKIFIYIPSFCDFARKDKINILSPVLFILLFGVFIFTRTYLLGQVFGGIHVDELGMSFDAMNLARFGVDRHGIRMPFYLANYGGGQSVLYAYMTALLLKLFPYSKMLIRVPAVICGSIGFISSYFLLKEMYGKKYFAFLGPVVITVMPFFMSTQRWGLDCNLMVSILTLATWLLFLALNREKNLYYILAGVGFGLVFYTYILSYLIMPIFLLLAAIYLYATGQVKIKNIIQLGIPIVVMALPLLIFQLVNLSIIPEFSVLFTDFKKLPFYRSTELSFANIKDNLGFIVQLFINNGNDYTHTSFLEYGPVYLFMIPLIIVGIVVSFVKTISKLPKRIFTPESIMIFQSISIYAVMLLVEKPVEYKANAIYLSFGIFIIIGIRFIAENIKGISSEIIYAIMLGSMALSFAFFVRFYFGAAVIMYPIHGAFFNTNCMDVMNYVASNYNPDGDKNIYVQYEYSDVGDYWYDTITALETVIGANLTYKEWDNSYDSVYEFEGAEYFGNVCTHLPDNFDANEDAVYIIGETWSYAANAVMEYGFKCDKTFPKYYILYKD